MFCKDCLYFKQWKAIEAAVCDKTGQSVETSGRPCDDFVSKHQYTNEWGESQTDKCKNCD